MLYTVYSYNTTKKHIFDYPVFFLKRLQYILTPTIDIAFQTLSEINGGSPKSVTDPLIGHALRALFPKRTISHDIGIGVRWHLLHSHSTIYGVKAVVSVFVFHLSTSLLLVFIWNLILELRMSLGGASNSLCICNYIHAILDMESFNPNLFVNYLTSGYILMVLHYQWNVSNVYIQNIFWIVELEIEDLKFAIWGLSFC